MWETNTRHHQQLPVQAAVEGPAACFRLMEVDDNGSDDDPKNRASMRHGHFIRLLMSATDNRCPNKEYLQIDSDSRSYDHVQQQSLVLVKMFCVDLSFNNQCNGATQDRHLHQRYLVLLLYERTFSQVWSLII